MFCINKLDVVTLRHILEYVVSDQIKYLSEWKSRLQYLHVCGVWSDMLTPLVMCKGFIAVYVSKSDGPSTPDGKPKLSCYSNTGIIIDRGYQSFATELEIASRTYIGFQDFFDVVFEQLKPDIYEWAAIARLGIYMISIDTVVANIPDNVTPSVLDNVYQACADTIYRCMPNVQKLTIKEPNEDVGIFTHMLTNRYAHRLIHIDSPNPISLAQSQFCSDLVHLRLKLDPNRKPLYLPYLRAAPLQYLDLFNIQPEFSWAEFYDANNRDIVFKNLQTLCLMYTVPPLAQRTAKTVDSKGVATKQQRFVYYRLHFPKLDTLRVYNCPFPSELLYCQQYFGTVPNVFIGGIMESVARAIDIGIKRQNDLKIHISEILPEQHKMFCTTTNYLLGGGNHSRVSQMVIGANLNTVDIRSIHWPHLVSLCICETINVDTFFSLTSILPSLDTAVASCLSIDIDALDPNAQHTFRMDLDNSDDYSKALDTLFRMFPVGSTCVKDISLYFDRDSPGAISIKASVAICLALSSLSIKKLAVDSQFQDVFAILGREIKCKQLPQTSIEVEFEEESMFMATFWHMFYLL